MSYVPAPETEIETEIEQEQPMYQPSFAPVGQLNARRGLVKFIVFNFLTLGIYSIVFFAGISSDINVIASRYDGRKTMHFCLLAFLVGPITGGIAYFVWSHNLSRRIGNELVRRDIPYSFGPADFWLWGVLGSFFIVGPFVYLHKLATASNEIAEHYNNLG